MSLLLLGAGGSGGVSVPPDYSTKFYETQASGLLAYWRLNELSGTSAAALPTTGYQATYTGMTLNSTTAPGGGAAPSMDGVNDVLQLQTTYVRDNFNGTSGTVAVWVNPSTNGVVNIAWFQGAATSARMYIQANIADSSVAIVRQAGGVTDVRQAVTAVDLTTWFLAGMTWDESDDEIQAWIAGTTIMSTDGIGAWTNGDDTTGSAIGRNASSGVNDFEGEVAHVGLWSRTLSAADWADLASTVV